MECMRCGNRSKRYFAVYQSKTVCRRCIGFTGDIADIQANSGEVSIHLPFRLSETQRKASKTIYQASLSKDVLVNAVCGAGKTELVYETIAKTLEASKTIGLAIARKQVVLQLAKRLTGAFPGIRVQAICEGHTNILDAQLFVVTTHQLYRFPRMFDCLILDEPDAFPYVGDELLEGFARMACRGRMIYLTATPDREMLRRVKKQEMVEVMVNVRPHGYPLPVPSIRCAPYFIQLILVKRWVEKTKGRKLVFVPTIRQAVFIARLFKWKQVSAKSKDLQEKIDEFANNEDGVLICTTVLERGVTFENAQVCVVMAQHPVFNEASLVQIAGRAGRSPRYPKGEVLFLCGYKSRSCLNCMNILLRSNKDASFASTP
ncbi:MAG: DEAD/DEAH box helicase family protein [Erysipelotrichaceae bacterium]|nr:DEAD/DEAH box helicase family protein [Erysipelotrichaceae bacterium]